MNKIGTILLTSLATLGIATGAVAIINNAPATKGKLNISFGETQIVGNDKQNNLNNSSELVALKTELDRLKEENMSIKAQLAGEKETVSTLQSQVSILAQEVDTKTLQVEDLASQIKANNTKIAELEASGEVDAEEIARLTTQNDNLNAQITTINADIEAKNEEISNLNSTISEHEANIIDLENQITQLNSNIAQHTIKISSLEEVISKAVSGEFAEAWILNEELTFNSDNYDDGFLEVNCEYRQILDNDKIILNYLDKDYSALLITNALMEVRNPGTFCMPYVFDPFGSSYSVGWQANCPSRVFSFYETLDTTSELYEWLSANGTQYILKESTESQMSETWVLNETLTNTGFIDYEDGIYVFGLNIDSSGSILDSDKVVCRYNGQDCKYIKIQTEYLDLSFSDTAVYWFVDMGFGTGWAEGYTTRTLEFCEPIEEGTILYNWLIANATKI